MELLNDDEKKFVEISAGITVGLIFIVGITAGLISIFSWFDPPPSYDDGLTAYEEGDYKTALREWKSLAEQGHAAAQGYLGLMYSWGRGVSEDDQTAVKWFTLAAEQGDAFAQKNLGWMYQYGQGVSQDYQTAVKWFTLAAEQGDASAQNNLGFMYFNGEGVIQDNILAYMWGSIAASLGSDDGAEVRDDAAKKMNNADISAAQKLAGECVQKNYKGC